MPPVLEEPQVQEQARTPSMKPQPKTPKVCLQNCLVIY